MNHDNARPARYVDHGVERPERRLRAGVIGAGNMGTHHARCYAQLGSLCSLTGVFDTDFARAEAVARRYETRQYTELDRLLEDVDVISIASPSSLHLEHALHALAAGLHILIEKPLATSIGDAYLIADAAADAPQQVVQVGHIEHFNPAVVELRKLLSGQELIALDVRRLSPFDGRITDADVVQDLMLHDIHVVLSLLQTDPSTVNSFSRTVHSAAAADYAVAQLIFPSDTVATLTASRVTEEKIRELTATTSDAHISVDYLNHTVEVSRYARMTGHQTEPAAYRKESLLERIYVPRQEPLLVELGAFLRSVQNLTPPDVGVEMGVRCVELVERVREPAAVAL